MTQKILVVEDDPISQRLMVETLQRGHYEVITASNGLEGVKKAQREGPDLVVLDVMLPGIDGFEICYRLRASSQTAQLPILMVSAKSDQIDKETGLKVGADDYMTKPILPKEVLDKIGALLAKKSGSREPEGSNRPPRAA